MQQRHILAGMLFLAVTIALAERAVLPMAITRMVQIPNQDTNATAAATEPICTAPNWATSNADGTTPVPDEAVRLFDSSIFYMF